jgi:hypothetical protein
MRRRGWLGKMSRRRKMAFPFTNYDLRNLGKNLKKIQDELEEGFRLIQGEKE